MHDSERELLETQAKGALLNPFTESHIDLNRWIDKIPPEREWLIKDLIPMGVVTSLFGTGGIGKSLLCQQIATALALGKHTFGETPRKYKVFGMYCEDDGDELVRRQHAICKHFGVSMADISDQMYLYSFVDQDSYLGKPSKSGLELTKVYGWLESEINRTNPDLIILDNISLILGGSKMDETVITPFFASLRRLCQGRALLVVGHTGKPNSEGQTSEYYGSVAFNNAVRQRLFFEVDGNEVVLSSRKSNYAKADYSVTMFYKDGAFELINPIALAKQKASDKQDKLEKGKKAIISMITNGLSNGIYYRQAHNATMSIVTAMVTDFELNKGLSRPQLKESLQSLINDGSIHEQVIGTDANRNKKHGLVLKDA